jgi:hypothetical protein
MMSALDVEPVRSRAALKQQNLVASSDTRKKSRDKSQRSQRSTLNLNVPVNFFIPGITGRARCLVVETVPSNKTTMTKTKTSERRTVQHSKTSHCHSRSFEGEQSMPSIPITTWDVQERTEWNMRTPSPRSEHRRRTSKKASNSPAQESSRPPPSSSSIASSRTITARRVGHRASRSQPGRTAPAKDDSIMEGCDEEGMFDFHRFMSNLNDEDDDRDECVSMTSSNCKSLDVSLLGSRGDALRTDLDSIPSFLKVSSRRLIIVDDNSPRSISAKGGARV